MCVSSRHRRLCCGIGARRACVCLPRALAVAGIAAWFAASCLFPLFARAVHAAGDASTLIITEVMVNPRAADDETGEWIEVLNLGPAPVNLLAHTLSTERMNHVIEQDVWIGPGQVLLLANCGDPAVNGGVRPGYVYTVVLLRNEEEELALIAPGGEIVDRVSWDEGTSPAPEGASLERQGSDAAAPWAAALSRWPGSAGDRGSPGTPYTPPPTATPSPSAEPSPTSTEKPTPAPTETATLAPTPLPDPPRIWLSEVMANPDAVPDEAGEWLEIFNGDVIAVNLNGWVLADLDHERATINEDVWIQPGEYLVLGRSRDASANGGLVVRYAYDGLQLANETDELLLLTPWGVEVDRFVWGDGQGPASVKGASLERTGFSTGSAWVNAAQSWPGSLGDLGSPNLPYRPRATPPATPGATPSATPAPPLAWQPDAQASPLVIDEVNCRSADQEYIVLANLGSADVDLTGWSIGDAETPGSGEGMHALPDGRRLAPGQVFVIARNGSAFVAQWGRSPDVEIEGTSPEIPNLPRRSELATGALALNDAGDEVILLSPSLRVADAVAYGDANYAALGLAGSLRTASGRSLQRVPGFRYPATADVRYRFLAAATQPFVLRDLPAPALRQYPDLGDGLIALWGALGASSNFSAEGDAPPHFVAASAAAAGLGFVAIADPSVAHAGEALGPVQGMIVNVPAWQWRTEGGAQAVIYGSSVAQLGSWADLGGFLSAHAYVAQALAAEPPALSAIVAVAADGVSAPGGLASLYRSWSAVGNSLLPAGNGPPPIDGFVQPGTRYTGLAVRQADLTGVLEALAARRGWLASTPGLRLTLRVRDGPWMGGTVQPANELRLEIVFSDRSGEPAGLALWQDGSLVRQLDTPSPDGRWEVTIPAVPGSFLYAVATELDGDFAVTAPIRVASAEGGRVLLNEALPAPESDLNGDGAIDSDDEFLELYNPGDMPVGLGGWRLTDRTGDEGGRQFVFGDGRYVPARGYLLLWRGETGLSLNDRGERIRLLTPGGTEVDAVQWEVAPGKGRSLARMPDGAGWVSGAQPSPGEYNRMPNGHTDPPKPPDPDSDGISVKETVALKVEQGEAPGTPGSLAAAKLMGLGAGVEFRAQVITPPELFNSAVYVAEPADASGVAGLGVQVYLRSGEFMPMAEGDWVLVRGQVESFRGEMEVAVDQADQVWRYAAGVPLLPLPVRACDIGESLESRLVTFEGVVTGWQGDSIFLCDVDAPEMEVRVTVRSSLDWKRPYVNKGERWRVTGLVSQFAREHPWNGGYRVLVRYEGDLVKVEEP